MLRREPARLGRNFGGLWAATACANLGDGLYLFALPLIAVGLTDSPGQVAAVTVMMTLAWPLFGLHAGTVVDRVNRRRLLRAVNGCRALILAVVAIAVFTESASIWLVYAVALVLGAAETLVDTALSAVVPAVVDRPNLGRANARIEATEHVANQFVGPPLGGLLAAVSLGLVAGLSALLYAAAIAGLTAVRGTFRTGSGRREPPAGRFWREATAGLLFLWRHPLLRVLTLFTAAMNIFWAAWTAVFVLFAIAPGPAGLNEAQYGLLLASMAVGGLAGSLLVVPLRRRLGERWLLALDVVGTILLIGTPAVTTDPWTLGMATFIAGGGSAVWRVIGASIRQTVVPDGLLGRTYSANRLISWGVLPAGAALGGLLAELAGVRSLFIAGGIASLLLLAAFFAVITPGVLALSDRSNPVTREAA